MSVWCSPWYGMFVCPLITSATAVSKISNWILMVHLVNILICIARYSQQWEWDGWAQQPGLTHLSMVCSPGPSVVLCVLYQELILHSLVDPLLAVEFNFHFSSFLICFYYMTIISVFNGSHCYTSSYYNYRSISPYYIHEIVIHILHILRQINLFLKKITFLWIFAILHEDTSDVKKANCFNYYTGMVVSNTIWEGLWSSTWQREDNYLWWNWSFRRRHQISNLWPTFHFSQKTNKILTYFTWFNGNLLL